MDLRGSALSAGDILHNLSVAPSPRRVTFFFTQSYLHLTSLRHVTFFLHSLIFTSRRLVASSRDIFFYTVLSSPRVASSRDIFFCSALSSRLVASSLRRVTFFFTVYMRNRLAIRFAKYIANVFCKMRWNSARTILKYCFRSFTIFPIFTHPSSE